MSNTVSLIPKKPVRHTLTTSNKEVLYMPLASVHSHGIVKIGDGLKVTTDGLVSVNFDSEWYSGVKTDISDLVVRVDTLTSELETTDADVTTLYDYFDRLRTNVVKIANTSGGFNAGKGSSGSGIAIGTDAKATSNSVALGDRSEANVSSIAIGGNAYSWGYDAVQIGKGTNNDEGTLKFRDFDIISKDGRLYTNLGTETEINMGLVASEKYVKDLLKTVTGGGISLIVVDVLPTEDISTSAIYLVPRDDGTYDEFVYVNDKWEQIGSTDIDLSNYVTLEEYNKLVNNTTQIKTTNNSFMAGGATSEANGNAVVIGNTAKIKTGGAYAVAIGYNTQAKGGTVAIGNRASTSGENAIAIGSDLSKGIFADGNNSIQLGTGQNSTANTLQIFDKNIYNHSTDTLSVANITLNGEDLAAKLESAGGGGDTVYDSYGAVVIGNNAQNTYTGSTAVSIGNGAITRGQSSIAIGESATAQQRSSIAIGDTAYAMRGGAIQLGGGVNSTDKTLQVGSDNIYNYDSHTLTVQNISLNGEDLATKIANAGGGSGVSQEDFDKLVNNEVQIVPKSVLMLGGATADLKFTDHSVLIGKARVNGANTHGSYAYVTAVGHNSSAGDQATALGTDSAASGFGSVALGLLAKTDKNAKFAFQIGYGTNNIPNTFQVRNDNIYNHETHTLTVQNIELNGVNLGTQLGDLNTALEAILGV